ncbi:tRNA(Met) cytidine acetyltransferase TmcA, partial [Natronolimnohabitans innermongolicus]
MDVSAVAAALFEEATAVDERRVLALSGARRRGYDALESLLESLPVPITETTLVGPDDRLRCEHLPQANASELLGTTRTVISLDAHDGLRPNALGKVVGAVDGGGLLVFLTPPLEEWPDERGAFDESLAVPPFGLEDVGGRFRHRLVETMRIHRGIGIVDLETETVVDDGLTHPAPRLVDGSDESVLESEPGLGFTAGTGPDAPPDARFPAEAYEACLTADQRDAVAALETLSPAGTDEPNVTDESDEPDEPQAVVLEADRGRGKSSAAGLAAGAFAADGLDVLVTAPRSRNAAAIFERAGELCETLPDCDAPTSGARRLETASGGRVRFLEPAAAVGGVDGGGDASGGAGEALEAADIVIVDEAAALPVAVLEALLAADRVAFATTVHGYEGAGRGFSVRFRDRLAEGDHEVTERTLLEPIRYAAGDPVEVWAFRALLLDARPPVEPLVADAEPETVEYRRLEPDDLLADEQLLREAFGLLVLAHYRTEPNDLARLLDAPNLEARALLHEGHVVSVALLAREGDLPPETRATMYEGGRVSGNMLPDVLTSQLRDESAG